MKRQILVFISIFTIVYSSAQIILTSDTSFCSPQTIDLYSLSAVQSSMAIDDMHDVVIPIGFDFPLYDQNYTECSVNANGWIGFGGDVGLWENTEIPNPDVPGPALFPFWDDLNPVNDNCNSYCSGNV